MIKQIQLSIGCFYISQIIITRDLIAYVRVPKANMDGFMPYVAFTLRSCDSGVLSNPCAGVFRNLNTESYS